MIIPKGVDYKVETGVSPTEVHIVANITSKSQASGLITCLRQCMGMLEGEKRGPRKPKIVAAAAAE